MNMNQLTEVSRSWELFSGGIPKSHIAQRVGVNRETIYPWIKAISNNPEGLLGFQESYLKAKKGERSKRKVDAILKARIFSLREGNLFIPVTSR